MPLVHPQGERPQHGSKRRIASQRVRTIVRHRPQHVDRGGVQGRGSRVCIEALQDALDSTA